MTNIKKQKTILSHYTLITTAHLQLPMFSKTIATLASFGIWGSMNVQTNTAFPCHCLLKVIHSVSLLQDGLGPPCTSLAHAQKSCVHYLSCSDVLKLKWTWECTVLHPHFMSGTRTFLYLYPTVHESTMTSIQCHIYCKSKSKIWEPRPWIREGKLRII